MSSSSFKSSANRAELHSAFRANTVIGEENRAQPLQNQGSATKRTGFFGGSFNPLHVGHIALARQLLSKAQLDEIWFVVTPLNPFKTNATDLIDDDLRLEMTRVGLADEPNMIASDYEFHLPKPSYTWNTLQNLTNDYHDRTFVLLIGADNWQAFDRWAHPSDILAHYEIVVYPRRNYSVDETILPPSVHLLDTELYEVSSTDIRHQVKFGQPIDGLVPPSIQDMVMTYYR